MLARRLDAVTRLRAVQERLSAMQYALLIALAGDQSWSSLGQQLGVRDVTVRAWTARAVMALSEVQ